MVSEFGHSPERARIVSSQKRRNRRKEKEETVRRPWGSKMLVRLAQLRLPGHEMAPDKAPLK
jgi:hypothetical protein